MKKYLLFLIVFLALSCEKDTDLTNGKNDVEINQGAILKFSGSLMPSSGISATGTVKVYLDNGIYKLKIENALVSSGPDLKVYLSKSDTPNEFINLGNFVGNGSSVYLIPTITPVVDYPYVLIHCQQHNHLYAKAKLNVN